MNVIALICARAGSKGIPGKNLRLLHGRPLIAWSIEQARAVKDVTRVLVSTDSKDVARTALDSGAEAPFLRPDDLARDDSPEWLVWRHALTFLQSNGDHPDALLVVPPTAPLRAVEDLDRCVAEYARGGADIVVTITDARRNPYYNMVAMHPDGTIGIVIPPDGEVRRRQDAPAVFDMTTVGYAVNPAFVMTRDGIFSGRVRSVHVPQERALDIDTPWDLRIAECLLSDR